MPKRSGKARKVTKLPKDRERDANQMASAVMRRTLELVGEEREKDPAAVALGRKGGLKGGRARMDSLSPEQRKKLAVKAARARWGKKSKRKTS